MSEIMMKYANFINANEETKNWLKTTGAKALKEQKITESEMEHVLDYLTSKAAPKRLQKMSLTDAKKKSKEWSAGNQKKGKHLVDSNDDIELIHDFLDGTSIVRLKTKKAYQREGFFMGHCVGGYDPANKDCLIYSYRDIKNNPHATFEIRKDSETINQIKGKGNGVIHPKYIHPILAFLSSIKINIRPNDMKNLGYYHVDKSHIPFIEKMGMKNQTVILSGEMYAY